MKFLVVSLLRLGDILLATSVVRSLKQQYPRAEIHILINGQFKSVSRLIPFVSKVYSFDRDGLQQIIGTPEHNLMEAYYRVEDLVEQLQTERYDHVLNLTHNRLSGWLTALVSCPNTSGVVFGADGKFAMGSDWFEYLNDFSDQDQRGHFHFVDVFHYGAGLEGADRRIDLIETDDGRAFVEKLLKGRSRQKRILIQAGSAEKKKTFEPKKWKQIARSIAAAEPDAEILVLGSPAEREIVNEISQGENFVPVIANLEEVYSLFNHCQLLITPDTSIKHLASATKIRILEVSLGSSEYQKTGAYTHGAVIIQGLSACSPCNHRTPCTQKTHECADGVSVEMVSLVTSAILNQDEVALRVLAHEFKEEAQILRTCINSNGDWSAFPMATDFSTGEIAQWIDRASFKLYLQKAHEKQVGEFGTEGLELKALLQNIFPDHSWREWVSELKGIETNMIWFEDQIGDYLNRLKAVIGSLDHSVVLGQFLDELDVFSRKMAESEILSSYSRQIRLSLEDATSGGVPFQIVKKIREKLSTARQRTKIELKLIRSLQSGFMEIV